MPPPVPPSVNAGRTIAGSPIVRERRVGRGRARLGVGALDDRSWRVRLADPVEQVAERLAVLGHLDRLERRAEEADRVALEHAARRPVAAARLSAVCPPSPASRPSGRSRAMTASTASTVSGSR